MEDQYQREIEDRILELRKQGKNHREIVTAVSRLTKEFVKETIRQFENQGRLHRIRAFNYNPDDSRLKTIVEMTKRRATLREIAKKLKISREWARVLKNKIRKLYGDEIFKPDKPFYTIPEIEKRLKVGRKFITALCKSGFVPYRCRGTKKHKGYLLNESGLEKIRKFLKIRCIVCGQKFIPKPINRQICSKRCREQRRHQVHLLTNEPTEENLGKWHLELWQRLKNHRLSRNEKWVTQSEACRRTSLSKMQIDWLGYRYLIKTRDHPAKKWHGQPVTQFSLSELMIADRIWTRRAK